MRENLGSSTWIQDYMEDNEETSVEEKWLNLKGKLTELVQKFVPKGVESKPFPGKSKVVSQLM